MTFNLSLGKNLKSEHQATAQRLLTQKCLELGAEAQADLILPSVHHTLASLQENTGYCNKQKS